MFKLENSKKIEFLKESFKSLNSVFTPKSNKSSARFGTIQNPSLFSELHEENDRSDDESE